MLVAGCPIADRAWAVPKWMDCLAKQTVRPDMLVFIHSGWGVEDPTWRAIETEAERHGFPFRITHDARPWHNRHDKERFRTLADLRNSLLRSVETVGADYFLSLDSDIMLERPDVIERLFAVMEREGADLASPLTFLHPQGNNIDVNPDVCWAYNAGWWSATMPRDHAAGWIRPRAQDVPIEWGGPDPVEIDIPMAVWLGNRKIIGCSYRWNVSGEDVGFAIGLEQAGALCVWDTSLRVRHVWEEQALIHDDLVAMGAQGPAEARQAALEKAHHDWVNSLEVQGS